MVQSKELGSSELLETSNKSPENAFSFYDTSKDDFNAVHAKEMTKITILGASFNSTRAQVADRWETFAEKDSVLRLIVQGSSVSIKSSRRSLPENIIEGHNLSVSDIFVLLLLKSNSMLKRSSMALLSLFREVLYGKSFNNPRNKRKLVI